MRILRFRQTIMILAAGWVLLFASCKEKNPEYPPRTWSEYVYTGSGISARDISAIYYENDHSLWFGAKGSEGLLYHDGYKWNVFDKTNTGIDFDSITSLVRDGNNKIWIGWKSGLAMYDGNNWQEINQFKGLRVTSVLVEGIGTIRVAIKGVSGGIATLLNNEWRFETLNNSDIPSGNINSIVSDNDQVLWLASADKGIIRLKNAEWENMSSELALLTQNFTSITKAIDGSIWAGSESSQLIHFYDNTFTILNTGTSSPITSTVIADNGNVCCSTFGSGLIVFNGITWISYTTENVALPSNDILTLAKGDKGTLFFSIPGGKVLIINH